MRRFRNGEDVRYVPLTDCKLRLRGVVPNLGERLFHCDHVEVDGKAYSSLLASTILRGSLQSGNPIPTCQSTRHG